MIIKKDTERIQKESFIYSAFTGWQISELVKAVLGGQNTKAVPFGKYLEAVGLAEKEVIDKDELERRRKISIQKSKSILDSYKKSRGDTKNGNGSIQTRRENSI
jgi:hypothetical protein